MQHVDGNAIAGPLADFFSFDVTTATARCNGCGYVAELARAMVYQSGAGTVMRCAACDQVLATLVESDAGIVVRCGQCDNVLATLVESGDRAWIGFSGVSAIEVRRTPSAG